MERRYRVGEVARALGVSRKTVRRWIKEGKVKPRGRLAVNIVFL